MLNAMLMGALIYSSLIKHLKSPTMQLLSISKLREKTWAIIIHFHSIWMKSSAFPHSRSYIRGYISYAKYIKKTLHTFNFSFFHFSFSSEHHSIKKLFSKLQIMHGIKMSLSSDFLCKKWLSFRKQNYCMIQYISTKKQWLWRDSFLLLILNTLPALIVGKGLDKRHCIKG